MIDKWSTIFQSQNPQTYIMDSARINHTHLTAIRRASLSVLPVIYFYTICLRDEFSISEEDSDLIQTNWNGKNTILRNPTSIIARNMLKVNLIRLLFVCPESAGTLCVSRGDDGYWVSVGSARYGLFCRAPESDERKISFLSHPPRVY